ncbi:uncharacterized protein EV420DRAFT_1160643 [Desarmillaria tabescens]|uniref:Uncharacterized protein n=1 Tax=Armillaria tabescens TaxID=1929756 RepID=A0AA39NCV6_ARMTA|nr:uncharacterized protein EV420DRAFT_1160643 [Desarmillaria tabescens]KAK0463204.1 hypothetical protein EV420DRAFT_1160643 [Desarmillaria tabescens]
MSYSNHFLSVQAAAFDNDFGQYGESLDWLASIMHRSLAYQYLYPEIWGCKQLFVEEEVLRDEDNRINVKVPKITWAFRPSLNTRERIFQRLRTRPFIRKEYTRALSNIIQAVRSGNENITVGDEDQSEEGFGEEEHADRTSVDLRAKRFREEGPDVDDREKKKQHLQDTRTSSDVGDEIMTIDCPSDEVPAKYPNPFLEYKESAPKVKGFIITGHPGIGKSIFLYYVLLLRLQASKPTILVTHPEKVTVFLRRGVFSISMADFEDVIQVIPATAWCLVDTSESLKTVPAAIYNTPFFVLQATAPKRKHLEWQNKVLGVHKYIMKPFSLSELIIGRNRSLDVSQTLSEKSLQEYYHRYTPSARFAYQHAGNLEKYATFVRCLVGRLTIDRLKMLVGELLTDVNSCGEQILYHILTITAEAGGQRSVPKVDVPSYYLSQLMTEQLQPSPAHPATVGATTLECC